MTQLEQDWKLLCEYRVCPHCGGDVHWTDAWWEPEGAYGFECENKNLKDSPCAFHASNLDDCAEQPKIPEIEVG